MQAQSINGVTARGVFAALGVVAEVAAALTCVSVLLEYSRDRRALAYRQTPAVVAEVRTRAVTHARGHRTYYYEWSACYRYAVGGREYASSKVAAREEWFYGGGSAAEAEARGSREYPVGREVAACYDPSRPGDAVLEVRDPSLAGLTLSGAFALLGLPGCAYGLLRTRGRSPGRAAGTEPGGVSPGGLP